MGTTVVHYERANKLPSWATPHVLKAMHEKEGKSLRQLAAECGVSHETIRNLIKRAR